MRTKKFFCLLLSGVLAFILLFGCSSTATVGSKTKSVVGAKKPYNIAVIIKATDSDYWQTLVKGAQAAQKKKPAGKRHFTKARCHRYRLYKFRRHCASY